MAIKEGAIARFKNQVNLASFSPTSMELRIMLVAIHKIPHFPMDDRIYYVSVDDMKMFGSNDKSIYEQMKQAAKTLLHTTIKIPYINYSGESSELEFNLVKAIDYFSREAQIGLKFNEYFMPYVSRVESEYTEIVLSDLTGLKGSYANRFYMLLSQWKTTGQMYITVDDLKYRFQLGKAYDKYSNLKSRIINQAIQEINESQKTAFKVTYKENRVGRNVKSLTFTITPKSTSLGTI